MGWNTSGNIRGPVGATGAQGPTGPTGATGATGAAGTTTWAGITDKPDVSINGTTATHTAQQIELGHASDTTLSRASAGRLAVEGVNVVTTSSTDTLTNKTLTAPKVDQIADTNGKTNISIGAVANAVNYFQVNNSASGNSVNLYALGSDTNINLDLNPKGTGQITAATVPVVTTTGTQTLTNKTLTNPIITQINVGSTPAMSFADGTFAWKAAVSNPTRHGASFETGATDGGWHSLYCGRTGSTGSLIGFYYGADYTMVGNITTNGSSTTYGTTSDYRLKNDVVDMSNGLERIDALRPVTYKWDRDGSDGEGFLAHELQAVIPLAVDGAKDAVHADGSIRPQNVDYSKIVVHLVAAVQELKAQLDDAKAQIAALT